jgi:hypothetical protein
MISIRYRVLPPLLAALLLTTAGTSLAQETRLDTAQAGVVSDSSRGISTGSALLATSPLDDHISTPSTVLGTGPLDGHTRDSLKAAGGWNRPARMALNDG